MTNTKVGGDMISLLQTWHPVVTKLDFDSFAIVLHKNTQAKTHNWFIVTDGVTKEI